MVQNETRKRHFAYLRLFFFTNERKLTFSHIFSFKSDIAESILIRQFTVPQPRKELPWYFIAFLKENFFFFFCQVIHSTWKNLTTTTKKSRLKSRNYLLIINKSHPKLLHMSSFWWVIDVIRIIFFWVLFWIET